MIGETETLSNGTWLKLGDAAHTTGVSEITLRRKVKTGKIPYEFRDGKYYVFIENSGKGESQEPRRTTTLPDRRLGGVVIDPVVSQPEEMKEASEVFRPNPFAETIATLNFKLIEREKQLRAQRRIIEDQETLIVFLEDTINDFLIRSPREQTRRTA